MTGILSIFTDLRTLVLFVITFTLIVAVHEFGHFATARLLGMKVLEFAFGFPPRAFSIVRGETRYSVNWIPFGGFVRILGQDDFSIRQEGEGDPRSFPSKPWWAQAIVLAAGVVMNFVLALVILTIAFATGTTAPNGDVRVFAVSGGSPAQVAGVHVGDLVKDVDGTEIHTARAMVNLTNRAAAKSQEIAIELERDGRPFTIKAVPRSEPPQGEGPLGVQLEEVQAAVSMGIPQAFAQAAGLTGDVVTQIVELPAQLFAQRSATNPGPPAVGGPIEIFRVTGQVAQFGIPTFLKLVGVLSVNLGVINIVPFPGLDGGRLFFVLLGALFRRRVPPKIEAVIHGVGFALLLLLLVFVSISDVRRAIGG
ncbi:MAG TPA: M50 family metallopeptidase [Candidatus Limnocylindria bacterium]|nr:M50 family metallopeptidase [Candidatus Limnocylindria bacterium]